MDAAVNFYVPIETTKTFSESFLDVEEVNIRKISYENLIIIVQVASNKSSLLPKTDKQKYTNITTTIP